MTWQVEMLGFRFHSEVYIFVSIVIMVAIVTIVAIVIIAKI